MTEKPSWGKHFGILDRLTGKKAGVASEDKPMPAGDEPTEKVIDRATVLVEKKEQAVRGLMAEYLRLKRRAVDIRDHGKIKDALAALAKVEEILGRAEQLHSLPINQADEKELDKIIAEYPAPLIVPEPDNAELLDAEIISATTPEGREISFNIKEQLKYWGTFYKDNKVDWVSLPETIKLTPEQIEKMKEMMAEGFDKLIIIPENLVSEPSITIDPATKKPTAVANPSYERLHSLMSEGYVATVTGGDYDKDGKFQGAKDKTTKLRLILTKDVQNLKDDPQFNATIGKSIDDLNKDELKKYTGFSEASYLVCQREYFKRTGKHLDEVGYTWLPESSRPLFGRVSSVYWGPDGEQLSFDSGGSDYHDDELGCRLAQSFEV